MLKFLPVLALCLLGAQAQKFNIGQCPSYDEQDNFDLKRFLGKWYEAQTYSHGYERNLKCVELDFTAGAKNNTMNLDIKWKDSRNNDGQIVDTAEMWYPGDFSSDMQIPMAPSFSLKKKINIFESLENTKEFLGKWYEAQTYSHGYERDLKCVELDFTAGANDTIMNLNIKWKDSRNRDGQIVDTANMWFPGDFSSDMKIPMAPSVFLRDGSSYNVLGTDYETYAVVYSCPHYLFVLYYLNYQNVWILTRDRNPSQQVLKNAQEAFKRNTFLEKWRLRNSNQRGC